MHRKSYYELLTIDTEIERTLRSLRKTKRVVEVIRPRIKLIKMKRGIHNKELWLKFGSLPLGITI